MRSRRSARVAVVIYVAALAAMVFGGLLSPGSPDGFGAEYVLRSACAAVAAAAGGWALVLLRRAGGRLTGPLLMIGGGLAGLVVLALSVSAPPEEPSFSPVGLVLLGGLCAAVAGTVWTLTDESVGGGGH